ncbi:MAG: hypothetical protein EWM72_00202 [Nitrospira sp.]|nr:MAG: hypothetical protein EWM72_00202 [Nitrospira sp.]
MAEEDLLTMITVDHHEGETYEKDCEAMSLDRLVRLTDEDGLIRLGLGFMEAFARAEGRILWH